MLAAGQDVHVHGACASLAQPVGRGKTHLVLLVASGRKRGREKRGKLVEGKGGREKVARPAAALVSDGARRKFFLHTERRSRSSRLHAGERLKRLVRRGPDVLPRAGPHLRCPRSSLDQRSPSLSPRSSSLQSARNANKLEEVGQSTRRPWDDTNLLLFPSQSSSLSLPSRVFVSFSNNWCLSSWQKEPTLADLRSRLLRTSRRKAGPCSI